MSIITKEVTPLSKNLIRATMYALLAKSGADEAEFRKEIAEKLGISGRMLTYYLDNMSQPSLNELFQIAQMLDTTIEKLVE